ncbi:hypothetical protein ACQEVF_49165 [Nonomuraea polychroma]|uniref:hypothetical protein n=1 Tax=Nonomuraea polychroma TaxID=46176 RepID=UPI003D90BE90
MVAMERDHPDGTAPTRYPGRKPPLWIRALFIPIDVVIVAVMADVRGIAMALFAGVVLGLLTIGSLAFWDRTASWSWDRPWFTRLSLLLSTFFVAAAVTTLPLTICAVIAGAVTLSVAALSTA